MGRSSSNVILPGEPYENLMIAIIKQAVYDYRGAMRRLKRKSRNVDARLRADDVEGFFRSEWFKVLTDVDGEYLIRKLQEECL